MHEYYLLKLENKNSSVTYVNFKRLHKLVQTSTNTVHAWTFCTLHLVQYNEEH